MKAYFVFEWKQFIHNKKNIALFTILIAAAFYYVSVLGPAYEPVESINQEVLTTKTTDRREYVDTYDPERDRTGFLMVAKMAFEELLAIDEPRLAALEEKDWQTYTKLSSQSYDLYNELIGPATEGLLRYNSKYFKYGQPSSYSEMEAYYGYYMTARRYENYLKEKTPLSPNLLEEKTAIQHLARLFAGALPYLLVILAIFLVIDSVSKDFRHATVLFGFPLSSGRKLVIKFLVALVGFTSLLLLTGGIIYFGIGLQFGFGSLNIPFTTYQFVDQRPISLPIWQYLAQNLALVLLHFGIIFWAFALLTLITKLEFLNLVVGGLYLFGDRFYFSRGKGYFFDYTSYPFSYVRTGSVLSGYDNFFYNVKEHYYNFQNGLICLGITLVTIFSITLLWTKRRRFRSL